jgi:hypothetical protein
LFTYFEINHDYIARVLCVNRDKYNPEEPEITLCGGQCYLDKKLKLVEETSTENEVPASRLKIEIPAFVVSEFDASLSVKISTTESNFTPYLHSNSCGVTTSIFHPPSES